MTEELTTTGRAGAAVTRPAPAPEHEPSRSRVGSRVRARPDRYVWLSLAVVLLMVCHSWKRSWGFGLDIWEHAAAVREFAAHPFDPRHPLLLMDRPHQFMSPYAFVLGLLARLTGSSVTTVLTLAGLGNLVLLLVALRLFVRRLIAVRHAEFWALLFVLFLWGAGAWFFSGFLHFDVVALVLPYPSTCAKALVLLALWAHLRFLESRDRRWLIPTFLVGLIVVLIHPVDALALYAGVGALTLGRAGWNWRILLPSAAVLVGSFLLAFAWPYFSLYSLLFGESNAGYREAIAAADHEMYMNVLGRTFPALLAVPFVFRRLRNDRLDPLALMFFGLVAAYWYGGRTENWSYGRLISDVMIVLSIVLAAELASAEEATRKLGPAAAPARWWLWVTAVGLVLFGVFNMRNGFSVLPPSVLRHLPYNWAHSYVDLVKFSDFSFLHRFGSERDVVLSDVYTSLSVPAFGPKVVGPARAEAFVDMGNRGVDIARFYDATTGESERRAIMAKYRVSLLLLNQQSLAAEPATYGPLLALGPELYRNQRFILIDVGRRRR